MALSTATGTLNVTTQAAGNTVVVSGLGFQPGCVLFFWAGRTATGSGRASAMRGFGAAVSPTDRFAVTAHSTDAVGTSEADAAQTNAACINSISAAGAQDGAMDLQSMDAGGFTLVIDDAFPADYLVHYLALGGASLTGAQTGYFTGTVTAPATQAVTVATGFTPSCVLFASVRGGANPPSTLANGLLSVGAMAGAGQQGALACGATDVSNNANTAAYAFGSECFASLNAAANAVTERAEFSSFDANGFTINWLERAVQIRVFYVALKGVSAVVGNLLTQTDTTTAIAESGFGFAPSALLVASHGKAQSTQDTKQDHDLWSLGFATSASARNSAATFDEDAVGTTEVTTAQTTTAVYQNINTTDAVVGLMDIQSFDSGGFTAIMDDADPAQAFAWYVALGPAADTTAPTLSNQTVDSPTPDGGTPKVTTDEGNGTAYMVVVPNGDSPSVAQIKAGQQSSGAAALAAQNQAVSATGVQTFTTVTGLSSSTAYDCWFVHTDAASNDSTAVKADFTTASGTQTFTPAAVVANWAVPAPTATGSGAVTLAPASVTASWSVPVATLAPQPVTLAPDATIAAWAVPDPTVTGSGTATALTPGAVTAAWTVPDPTLAPQPLTLTPDPVTATWSVPAVTVVRQLTPAAVTATWTVPDPTLAPQPVTLTPDAVAATWTVPDPTFEPQPLTLTPDAVTATWVVPEPSITGGAIVFEPDATVATWTVPASAVTGSGTADTLTPSPATATWTVPASTVAPQALTITPAPTTATWSVPASTVTGSGEATALTPAPTTATWFVPASALVAQPVTFAPTPATATWNVPAPTVAPQSVTLTPAPASATWNVPNPTIVGGSFAPAPVVASWVVPASAIAYVFANPRNLQVTHVELRDALVTDVSLTDASVSDLSLTDADVDTLEVT